MKKLLHLLIGLTASVAIAKTDCTAYFTVKTADCTMPNPTLVHFLDQSVTVPEGRITYTWSFGDGSSSHDRFPSHNYAQPGTYYACLHIREDINGQIYEADYCQDVTVQRCCDIEADFDLCVNPKNNKVHFTNLTTGADYYYWTFGDGGVSSDVNPVHQFTAAGTYQVCLIAYDSTCTDTAVFNLTICGGTQEPCRREGYIIPVNNNIWYGNDSTSDSINIYPPQIAGTCLGAYYNGIQLQNVTWSVNGQTFVANEYCYDLVLPGTYVVCLKPFGKIVQ